MMAGYNRLTREKRLLFGYRNAIFEKSGWFHSGQTFEPFQSIESMRTLIETQYDQNYTRYQLNRSPFRKFLRRYYLSTLSAQVKGKAVDFGCGTGALLPYLPEGSIGFEVNRSAVDYCMQGGLNVIEYNFQDDRYRFHNMPPNKYQTFIMNHVLEHIEDADMVLRQILISCQRLGIERIILVLPTIKGFLFDATHKTFVTLEYLENKGLRNYAGFGITGQWYFPFNKKWIGNYFTYHELRIVYNQEKNGR